MEKHGKDTNWRLFDRKEMASLLRISPNHLAWLTQQGIIPHYRLGRCIRYDPDDVKEALQLLKVEGSVGSASLDPSPPKKGTMVP